MLTAQERKEAPVQEEDLAVDPEAALGTQRGQPPQHESAARNHEEDREEDSADVHPALKFHLPDPLPPQARQRPLLRTASTRRQLPPINGTGSVEIDNSGTNVPLAVSEIAFA